MNGCRNGREMRGYTRGELVKEGVLGYVDCLALLSAQCLRRVNVIWRGGIDGVNSEFGTGGTHSCGHCDVII